MYNYQIFHREGMYCAVVCTAKGIRHIIIPSPSEDEVKRWLKAFFANHPGKVVQGGIPLHIASIIFDLHEGKSWEESLKLDLDLSDYSGKQQAVYQALRQVPPGETITYAQLAYKSGLGRTASRFVGNCMAINPVPLLVPCHRVLRADGSIGNYSAIGGVERKLQYLNAESQIYVSL